MKPSTQPRTESKPIPTIPTWFPHLSLASEVRLGLFLLSGEIDKPGEQHQRSPSLATQRADDNDRSAGSQTAGIGTIVRMGS